MIRVEKDFDRVPPVLCSEEAFKLLRDYVERKTSPNIKKIYTSEEVKEELRKLYKGKCAYCEQKIDGISYIFHYRPRLIYPEFIIEWSNILPTCLTCNNEVNSNRNKIDNFEVEEERFIHRGELKKQDRNLIANSHHLLAEKALLIHPELYEGNTKGQVESPEKHIIFLPNGTIKGKTANGVETINVFDLNRDILVSKRKRKIIFFVKNINQHLRLLKYNIVNVPDKKIVTDLLTTTIYEQLGKLRNNIDSFEEFAGLYREMWFNFKIFFKPVIDKESFTLLILLYDSFKRQKEAKIVIDTIFSSPVLWNSLTKFETGYLDELVVENYFSLKNIKIDGLKDTREIYFLGENGDGKTLLLQAILIGLKEHYLKTVADKKLAGTILQYIKENKNLITRPVIFDNNKIRSIENDEYLDNIYAYGTNRNLSNATDIDDEGYLSLFDNEIHLLNPKLWLLKVHANASKSKLTVDKALKLLEALLNGNVEIERDGEDLIFRDIRFKERGTQNLKFNQLSDGYKSVMTWVADLVSRLAKKQPNKDLEEFEGIVLVDEIGLHLHPKWETELARKLTKWFPKIQFIFTTHSPIMILSASEDAVFYKVYKENGVTKISDKFYCKEFIDYRLNTLVTSPLFGLEKSTMKYSNNEKLEVSDDDYMMRIRRQLDEAIKEKVKKGILYTPPKDIDDMIKNFMSN